ncbi:MAG: hypothetical protein MI757_12605 [Pirellulales bacterium]|nr:hypothetical protein [Pirellulales bacterium]
MNNRQLNMFDHQLGQRQVAVADDRRTSERTQKRLENLHPADPVAEELRRVRREQEQRFQCVAAVMEEVIEINRQLVRELQARPAAPKRVRVGDYLGRWVIVRQPIILDDLKIDDGERLYCVGTWRGKLKLRRLSVTADKARVLTVRVDRALVELEPRRQGGTKDGKGL